MVSSDGHQLIFQDEYWLHRVSINGGHLLYLDGLVPGLFSSLMVDADRIRFLKAPTWAALELTEIKTNGGRKAVLLNGDADKLLDQWENRFGMKVGDLGDIQSYQTLFAAFNQ